MIGRYIFSFFALAAAILAAYACHYAPGVPGSCTMPEFIWGAIAVFCLLSSFFSLLSAYMDG